jgi:hypothetical protein
MNWKDKRLKELQDMIDNGCHPELLIDEYNDIQTTGADSWEQFLEEQEERKLKYQPQLIQWRSIIK